MLASGLPRRHGLAGLRRSCPLDLGSESMDLPGRSPGKECSQSGIATAEAAYEARQQPAGGAAAVLATDSVDDLGLTSSYCGQEGTGPDESLLHRVGRELRVQPGFVIVHARSMTAARPPRRGNFRVTGWPGQWRGGSRMHRDAFTRPGPSPSRLGALTRPGARETVKTCAIARKPPSQGDHCGARVHRQGPGVGVGQLRIRHDRPGYGRLPALRLDRHRPGYALCHRGEQSDRGRRVGRQAPGQDAGDPTGGATWPRCRRSAS